MAGPPRRVVEKKLRLPLRLRRGMTETENDLAIGDMTGNVVRIGILIMATENANANARGRGM